MGECRIGIYFTELLNYLINFAIDSVHSDQDILKKKRMLSSCK